MSYRLALRLALPPPFEIHPTALVDTQVEPTAQKSPGTSQCASPKEAFDPLNPEHLAAHRKEARPCLGAGGLGPAHLDRRGTLGAVPARLLRVAVPRREHDARLDHVDGRGDHRRERPGGAGGDAGDGGALEQRVGRPALRRPSIEGPLLDVLEQRELQGRERQVARREGRVAAPQLRGAVEALQGGARGAAVEGFPGARDIFARDDLGVLLEDFGGGED